MKTEALIKGNAYMVKHINSQKAVRRIFKGTEQRFGNILCYVFTGKVNKSATVKIEELKNGVTFWYWKGVKHAPNEISIPYYDLRKATEA